MQVANDFVHDTLPAVPSKVSGNSMSVFFSSLLYLKFYVEVLRDACLDFSAIADLEPGGKLNFRNLSGY